MGPVTWLEEHGDALYRYAMLRVNNTALAEDLVQETLLAGVENYASFKREASIRTWLVGILKHKIVDYLRKQNREVLVEYDELTTRLDAMGYFNSRGRWKNKIPSWGTPDKLLEDELYWKVLQECINQLPQHLATFFTLREIDDLSTDDLCKVTGMKENNVWTTLSRIRMKLRACLEANWLNH